MLTAARFFVSFLGKLAGNPWLRILTWSNSLEHCLKQFLRISGLVNFSETETAVNFLLSQV